MTFAFGVMTGGMLYILLLVNYVTEVTQVTIAIGPLWSFITLTCDQSAPSCIMRLFPLLW